MVPVVAFTDMEGVFAPEVGAETVVGNAAVPRLISRLSLLFVLLSVFLLLLAAVLLLLAFLFLLDVLFS